MGLGVIGIAFVQQPAQVGHGVGPVLHGAQIALRHNPCHVVFRLRAKPYDEACRQQRAQQSRVGDDAAAGFDHAAFVPVQRFQQRPFFEAPIACLTRQRKDLRNAHPGEAFRHADQADEREPQPFSELHAQRALAGPAQTDQRDPAPGLRCGREALVQQLQRLLLIVRGKRADKLHNKVLFRRPVPGSLQQVGNFRIQRRGDSIEKTHRYVAAAGLQVGQVALGNPGLCGQGSTCHVQSGTQRTHTQPEPLQQTVRISRRSRTRYHRATRINMGWMKYMSCVLANNRHLCMLSCSFSGIIQKVMHYTSSYGKY